MLLSLLLPPAGKKITLTAAKKRAKKTAMRPPAITLTAAEKRAKKTEKQRLKRQALSPSAKLAAKKKASENRSMKRQKNRNEMCIVDQRVARAAAADNENRRWQESMARLTPTEAVTARAAAADNRMRQRHALSEDDVDFDNVARSEQRFVNSQAMSPDALSDARQVDARRKRNEYKAMTIVQREAYVTNERDAIQLRRANYTVADLVHEQEGNPERMQVI